MAVQHLLDLDRVDVLAAGDDHVLLAVDERQIAVLAELAQVASEEPAVPDCVAGRVFHLPIADEDVVAADDELADLTSRKVLTELVGDPEVDQQRRLPHGPSSVDDVLHRKPGASGAGLGHAEAFGELPPLVLEELDHRDRAWRAAGDAVPHLGGVVGVEIGHLGKRGPHRRDHELHGRLVVLHLLERVCRNEGRQDDDLATEVKQREGVDREPADVEERRRRDGGVVFRDSGRHRHDVDVVGLDVVVREHRALGAACRA